ncbi:3409_t:CDS:2, partial [Scutellospora calospora]
TAESLRRPWCKIVEFMEDASNNKSIDLSIFEKSSFMKEMLQQFNFQKILYKESKVAKVCTAIKETMEEIALCLDKICVNYHQEYKSHLSRKDSDCLDPEKVSLIVIGLYEDLSRFTLSFYKEDSLKTCICYVEKAHKIAYKTSCIEGLLWVSNSYYRIGAFYHNNDQARLAVEPIQYSCTILDQYVCKIQQIGGKTSKNLEATQVQLSK